MSAINTIVTGGIGALIGILIAQGFQQVQALPLKNGDTKITGFRPSDNQRVSVQIRNNAILSPQFDFTRITTDKLVFPNDNQPDYEFKNDSGIIKRIFALTLVPDATFKSEGILKVSINEAPFIPARTNSKQGDFQDIDSLNVPIPDSYGIKILPKEKLKVFIRNPSGNLVGLTIGVFVGELP